ncbi:MAG: MarR family winged helix-turn-helix transcriptional regulator [Chloroflexota bacterium]
MPEPITPDAGLTTVAVDLLKIFQGMPRVAPRPPVRDLTLGQLRLLLELRGGPMSMGAIAETFELSSTAATGFVTRIERHGLVVRQHRSDDRRVVECVLTEDGQHFVDEVVGVRLDSVRQSLSLLTPRQLSSFHELVRHIIDRRGAEA